MKYLKVTILEPAGSPMVYPVNYQTEIGNFAIDHLYYDAVKGDGKSELVLLIPDAAYKTSMIRTNVEALNETQATTISNANETRTETIKDEAKLRRLELKSRLGIALSTEELDAVDPQKSNAVFSTSKILTDRIAEFKLQGL